MEGNVVSFKVFIDSEGLLMTEYSKLPRNKLAQIFSGNDLCYIEKILSKVDPKFRNLHKELEEELEVLK
jgi:hypothetical protein|tara:strand:- start:39 stop:245 length:207 start_codon:yes stop_codon:yes gene_type:complete